MKDITEKYRNSEEEIRRAIIHSLKEYPLKNSLPLLMEGMGDESWRVRKESVEIFSASSPSAEDISALLTLFRNGENAGARNSAVEAITRCGELSITALIPLINDNDPDVRKFAVDALGGIHSKSVIEPLLSALKDCDVNVASAAAEHLGTISDTAAVQPLLDECLKRGDNFFRFNALSAIGKISAPAPLPPQITELVKDEILRKAVYEALGSIGDISAAKLLADGLALKQKSARNAAITALYKIYSRSSSEIKQQIISDTREKLTTSIDSLIDAYSPSDHLRTEAVLTLLENLADIKALPLFLHVIDDLRLAPIAVRGIKKLGENGFKKALEIYDSSDENTRGAICRLCSECKHKEFEDLLLKALDDYSSTVKISALFSIGKLGIIKALPKIQKLIDDAEPEVSLAAESAILSMALIDKKLINSIKILLSTSEKGRHRSIAANLSAALGDTEKIMHLAKDPEPSVREAAVKAVGKSHISCAESLLLMALVDEDADVRIAAAEAIGETGKIEMASTLEKALSDSDEWVRISVINSLFRLAPSNIQKHILSILPKAEGGEKMSALKILDSLQAPLYPEIFIQLRSFADDKDREIAALAKKIIMKPENKRVDA